MHILPQFDPIAISLGPFNIHWYALSYLLGFALFMILGRRRIKQGLTRLNNKQLDDLLTYGVLGVIIGGRLGYVFFYQASSYLHNPINILKVWEGGMSFHGGLLGVIIAMWIYAKRHNFKFSEISDFVAPLVPLGLASGRIGNFINGELWGRVTRPDAWWATGFPHAQFEDSRVFNQLDASLQNIYLQYGMLPRHPSQLYECLLEGIILFIILWLFSSKKRPLGQISALFLIAYGSFRFIVEYTREPDSFLGLLTAGLSMGQWLCIPMIATGIIWFIITSKRNPSENTTKINTVS